MADSMIQIPSADEIPSELKQAGARVTVKPKLPEVNPADLPEPIGWRVLVLPVSIPTETESGFQLAADTVRHLHLQRRIGVVLGIGPLAFSELRGFPPGFQPFEVGDWVGFHEMAGTDQLITGKDGGLVSIKFLSEADILCRIKRPDAHMTMV